MLLRTDPDHHRLYYLSIPRDLRVEIPGYGDAKINAAFQVGGPRLAITHDRRLHGHQINHVIVVNFAEFRDLIDKVGGIDVVVPRADPLEVRLPVRRRARCARWHGWRFAKGKQHMDGRRALIYSRVRENPLDPAENDITRGERNQQVLQAMMSKLAELRDVHADAVHRRRPDEAARHRPLANEFVQLGWIKFRAGSTITAGSAGSRPAATSRRARTTRR